MGTVFPKFYLIIVAAGTGQRVGGHTPKQYVQIQGKEILRHTVERFQSFEGLVQTCIVIHPDHESLCQTATDGLENVSFCHGGKTRQESVYNGINMLQGQVNEEDIILVHDAARPFVALYDIEALLRTMNDADAATLAHQIVDTLRYADSDGYAAQTVARENLWGMQTPQAFKYGILKSAHDNAKTDVIYTDDTDIVSASGVDVKYVAASTENFKITTADDLQKAQMKMAAANEIRIGMGFDVHAFDDDKMGTSVRLCGVDIPHEKPLKGHSDADVGLHTITDAILGAIGEGDIGQHFPPSDDTFKNMDSAVFLEHAMGLLRKQNGRLVNLDITLICEAPKIGVHKEEIEQRLSDILNVSVKRVNLKATTTERLGFTGRKEGIAAQAVVSVTLPVQCDNG